MNYLRIIDCSAKKIFFGITIITSGVVCFAAEADRGSLKHLKEEIDIRGHAPVLIHLIDSSLDEIKSSKIALSNRVQQAEEKLLAELDGEYVRDWKWKNDLGQIELYLSGNGIDILSQSINAISFDIGGGWKKTTKLQSWDDSYDVIYSKITKNSLAKGLVVPHVSNLSIEPMKDGRISLTAPGSMPFCVELDNLKDTDVPIHQPAAMLVAAD